MEQGQKDLLGCGETPPFHSENVRGPHARKQTLISNPQAVPISLACRLHGLWHTEQLLSPLSPQLTNVRDEGHCGNRIGAGQPCT
jgi:hypothetical protein